MVTSPSFLLLVFLISFLGHAVQANISNCCRIGISDATKQIVLEKDQITCSISNADKFEEIQNKLNLQLNGVTQKLLCKTIYKQCCISSVKSNFCTTGIELGQSNAICSGGKNDIGGGAAMECCDCCKVGEKAASKREDCDAVKFKNDLCTHAYRKCCKDKEQEMPIQTTQTPQRKTCSDIVCDKASTVSCGETNDGPVCHCKDGYFAGLDKITCHDMDECLANKTICSVGKCQNTMGSYECVCDVGFEMQDNKCVKSTDKECRKGFELKDGECVDINECVTGAENCHSDLMCLNVNGTFRCIEPQNCHSKYQAIYSTITNKRYCEDIDECAIHGNQICRNPFTECINIVGGYQCKQTRCQDGLKLLNGYCTDIDECIEQPGICGEKGRCINLSGSYSCICNEGYKPDPATKKCIDVNECRLKLHQCSYQCINTPGSYYCKCPTGYEARSTKACNDIDECATGGHDCSGSERCFNTYGSYRCIDESCPAPYYIRTGRKDRPQGCQKHCYHIKSLKTRKLCQNKKSFIAIRRRLFEFQKQISVFTETVNGTRIRKSEFRFRYWWTYSNKHHHVKVQIVKGNEDGYFAIERKEGAHEIFLFNKYDIKGYNQFHLVMETEVTQQTISSTASWRYQYHFYISVSNHQFIRPPTTKV
ncbi:EGF-containing fibulin-like extracellular matrix protein 2 isoform X1 [Clytia hemisphaerica]|uniref:Fibulin-1 n=1 Tax=Clytia hemisphaerica TaxID=252671 RepID=A0A7M5V700_9CNID